PLPGDADVIVLPGSKSTRGDLAFLRGQGWDIDLAAHIRQGRPVLGICGGYQMLGRTIADPEGIEGEPGTTPGLGHLDIETVMVPDKTLTRSTGVHLDTGQAVTGYEIHIGRTEGPDCARPVISIAGRNQGAQSAGGQIQGLYLHGLFAEDGFRAAWLASLGAHAGPFAHAAAVEATLDDLANHLEAHADLDGLLDIARAGC
ncbi:MAG: cobyric acid synthase CobQ, partial [Pseudomonadota bacterium]